MYTIARYPQGPMDHHELRRIMYSWPEIMGTITDPWALTFSANIWESYSNPKWRPTLRQGHLIRALYRENYNEDEEHELVEK